MHLNHNPEKFRVPLVELDDADIDEVNGGTTSIPCGTIAIASITQCFGDSAIWGSCKLGTRACC
ncbi:chromosome condensation protein CrcB [Corynebacterium sp. CNJ-954]|nr:chromosome condensation protein CrcB [Corynebacterium sp. CNJ-954]